MRFSNGFQSVEFSLLGIFTSFKCHKIAVHRKDIKDSPTLASIK